MTWQSVVIIALVAATFWVFRYCRMREIVAGCEMALLLNQEGTLVVSEEELERFKQERNFHE